jgi:hypothetical protein
MDRWKPRGPPMCENKLGTDTKQAFFVFVSYLPCALRDASCFMHFFSLPFPLFYSSLTFPFHFVLYECLCVLCEAERAPREGSSFHLGAGPGRRLMAKHLTAKRPLVRSADPGGERLLEQPPRRRGKTLQNILCAENTVPVQLLLRFTCVQLSQQYLVILCCKRNKDWLCPSCDWHY